MRAIFGSLLALCVCSCERVALELPDGGTDAAQVGDGASMSAAPVIDSINGGLPVALRGGVAQFPITGPGLVMDGQPAVEAVLNGRALSLRVVNGVLNLVTDTAALTRADLPGVAELQLRSRDTQALSATRLFRYYSVDTPIYKAYTPALPSSVQPVALGDIDGDGTLDRVEATGAGALTFKLTGGGTLADIQVAGDTILAVALADLNGDRRLDLVAVYRSGTNHSAAVFYRREGTPPAFDPTATLVLGMGAGAANTASITPADLNDDGRIDLTFALYAAGRPTPVSTLIFTSEAR